MLLYCVMSGAMTGGISLADLFLTGHLVRFFAFSCHRLFRLRFYPRPPCGAGDEPAARCQCLASGLVRDGRFFRSGPASLRVCASPSPF